MSRPSVVILCPKEFKFTDHEASVERPLLHDVADLQTVWLEYNAAFPAEVIDAHAVILWHGPLVTQSIVAQMKNCRAIIRNGVGFDNDSLVPYRSVLVLFHDFANFQLDRQQVGGQGTVGMSVVLVYTLFGGMWSVAVTTFVQMIVIVLGLFYIAWLVSDMTGGFAMLAYPAEYGSSGVMSP